MPIILNESGNVERVNEKQHAEFYFHRDPNCEEPENLRVQEISREYREQVLQRSTFVTISNSNIDEEMPHHKCATVHRDQSTMRKKSPRIEDDHLVNMLLLHSNKHVREILSLINEKKYTPEKESSSVEIFLISHQCIGYGDQSDWFITDRGASILEAVKSKMILLHQTEKSRVDREKFIKKWSGSTLSTIITNALKAAKVEIDFFAKTHIRDNVIRDILEKIHIDSSEEEVTEVMQALAESLAEELRQDQEVAR